MPHFNLRYFLETLGKENKDVFVLQIGAMDGKTFDPVYEFIAKYRWGGLMVEPMEDHFSELQKTYAGHGNIAFDNVAIAEEAGKKIMHFIPTRHIKNGDVPNWGLGASSFYKDRNALEFKEVSHLVEEKQVQCLSLNQLLKKHNIKNIDIMQIDAEGFDYHILKQLDFSKYHPKVIHIEIVNMPKSEATACKHILDANGYLHTKAGYNLLAISPKEFFCEAGS